MTSTTTDQILEIKKAEEKAKKMLLDQSNKLQEQQRELSSSLASELNQYQKSLRSKKVERIDEVKEIENQEKKTKVQQAETENQAIIKAARGRQDEAVKYVENKFMEYIKA